MNNLRVKSLYLEGFAKIHTGMHIDKLYLDFESMPNPTYLFVGDSGSGKSSTLRSIHPFAFNSGAGDETSNSKLIMDGRDGKKIITYQLDHREIKCTHIYLRKSDQSIQVKSFFSVNDEELNPSGLVSTFKELVQKYFYIDESFLTLLSLGNSVKSIVEHTSSERKKLSVKLFSELNIYMTYYKNASAVVRELKSVLNSVVGKLQRYGNCDKKSLKKTMRELDKLIANSQNTLSEVYKDQGKITSEQNTIEENYLSYQEGEKRITELLSKIEGLKRKRKDRRDSIALQNERDNLYKDLVSLELRLESLKNTISSELNFKESKVQLKTQLENSLYKMENSINRLELEKLIANVDAELSGLTDVDINKTMNYKQNKDDLVKSNIYLDELRSMCSELVTEVELPELIEDTLSRCKHFDDFETRSNIAYQAAVERVENLKLTHHIEEDINIPKIESSCEETNCPYKRFYHDIITGLKDKQSKEQNILRDENKKLLVVSQVIEIRRIIYKLYNYIDSHKKEFQLPKEIFDKETFILKYIKYIDREIYNRELLSETINYMERATRKQELLELKETTISQLNGINNTIEVYESMQKELESITRTINDSDTIIAQYQTDLEYNEDKLKSLNATIKELDGEISLVKEIESIRVEFQEIQRKLSNMNDLKTKYDSLNSKLQSLKDEETSLKREIENYRNNLNNVTNTLESIENLETEQFQLSEKYSEAVMIKEAVSPSKGIPVEFIDNVIRHHMIDSINELMHVAYPDITLLKDPDNLIINEKEFTIPYKKNGVIIGDISEASDGERAMLSLAFSLVLIRLVSKVYNIMLLDEMDTSLDKYGRTKYIDIIEQYMETINASQIFLISHNSMFDMYGVNILQTTKGVTTTNESTVVVPVYEQNISIE